MILQIFIVLSYILSFGVNRGCSSYWSCFPWKGLRLVVRVRDELVLALVSGYDFIRGWSATVHSSHHVLTLT